MDQEDCAAIMPYLRGQMDQAEANIKAFIGRTKTEDMADFVVAPLVKKATGNGPAREAMDSMLAMYGLMLAMDLIAHCTDRKDT